MEKVKKITGIFIMMFLLILAVLGIMYVWDFINTDTIKDVLVKVGATFGIVYIISVGISYFSNTEMKDGQQKN